MVDAVRSGKYKALVLDAPVLDYIVATNPWCDLYTVGDSFDNGNMGMEFPATADDAIIRNMSYAILNLQVGGVRPDVLADITSYVVFSGWGYLGIFE